MAGPDPFGETIVGWLHLDMARSGAMRISGTITDEASILAMIDTARASLVENFRSKKEGKIIVPAYDTAVVGTDLEKHLLKSVEELHQAKDAA